TVGVDKDGKITSKDRPTIELVLAVLEGGDVLLRHNGVDYPLTAPPGPALVNWDSVSNKIAVSHLEKRLPTILPTGPEEEKYYKEVCARADRLNKEPIDKLLKEYRASVKDKEPRAAAVVYGAIDDLPNLLDCLADKKNADLRDYAVTVLRNWIGRGPGQVE